MIADYRDPYPYCQRRATGSCECTQAVECFYARVACSHCGGFVGECSRHLCLYVTDGEPDSRPVPAAQVVALTCAVAGFLFLVHWLSG